MSDFREIFGDWRPDDDAANRPEGAMPEPENRHQRPLNEKEVKVVNVFEGLVESQSGSASNAGPTYFIQLRDNSGREFRIFVLRDMAYSISMALEADPPDRPFTHDLLKTCLDRLGAHVERVTIDDLWQDTFYAKVTVTRNGETIDIDARPSDAIAIAIRYKAPIYVAEYVLETAQCEP